jgi:hypothetical protein
LTQEEAAQYYHCDPNRMHPSQQDVHDFNPDCPVNCDGFRDWKDHVESLQEEWSVCPIIEDCATRGGGTRGTPNKPSLILHDDNSPVMQGYLPACPVHLVPSPDRQKQYCYKSRWQTRVNRDFTFFWAEDLLQSIEYDRRRWDPYSAPAERGDLYPICLCAEDYEVPREIICDRRERHFEVFWMHFVVETDRDGSRMKMRMMSRIGKYFISCWQLPK